MTSPTLGLLPLYIALYDEVVPERRPHIEAFYERIAQELEKRGLKVLRTKPCRLEPEFSAAVKQFETEGAEALVTLHLAYSPSLESAAVLAATKLPILVLDTTEALSFGPDQDPDEIMYNHGIHGVQDLCNLLLRHGKRFHLEAGHWEQSPVLDRIAQWARATHLASRFRNSRVGILGEAFRGMGDFAVPAEKLAKAFGIEVIDWDAELVTSLAPCEDDPAVQQEVAEDLAECEAVDLDPAAHLRVVRAGMAVRRWVEHERLTAFTVNFLAVDKASGLPTMPFMEAGKAMQRGIGYAGEGDTLTAALVGALLDTYPETTFCEMFCPDWSGGTIFLSHMGEVNPSLLAGKPELTTKPFNWTDVDNPAVAVGCLKGGEAAIVNLAPLAEGYRLIVAPGQMEAVDKDAFAGNIRGWFRPQGPVADFLAAYSRAGGTHHSALVYGACPKDLCRFGEVLGFDVLCLGE
jgi:L-arabinose isomerase